MKSLKHWQDAVNAVLGVALVLSPWALGFGDHTAATSNAVIVGVLLAAAALGAIFMPQAWEEWTEGVLGLWMIVSPWLLGFADLQPAMLTAVVLGVVVTALALWTLATDKDYSPWLRGRAAQ